MKDHLIEHLLNRIETTPNDQLLKDAALQIMRLQNTIDNLRQDLDRAENERREARILAAETASNLGDQLGKPKPASQFASEWGWEEEADDLHYMESEEAD
jgi:hypothetical protein